MPSRTARGTARRAWLVRTAAAAFVAAAPPWARRAQGAALAVGQPAPPIVLHTLSGESIASDALTGKVVILTFWATWCEPCRAELPLLSAFARAHAAEGLVVLGFSLDEPGDLAAVERVAATLSFPVGFLGSAYAGGYGRVWHLPVSFTIDRKGILVDNGWDDDDPVWTEARLESVVVPLLRQK